MEQEIQCTKEDYQEFQNHLQQLIRLSDNQQGLKAFELIGSDQMQNYDQPI
jgi:hypothetical protein